MSRRLGILSVLLLCLAGFAPSIWACAAMEQREDCCPPGHPPCDGGKVPASTGVTTAACCASQPAPTQSVASLGVQEEHVLSGSPPAGGWRGIPSVSDADRVQRIRAPVYVLSPGGSNQQELYLQTGRLRL